MYYKSYLCCGVWELDCYVYIARASISKTTADSWLEKLPPHRTLLSVHCIYSLCLHCVDSLEGYQCWMYHALLPQAVHVRSTFFYIQCTSVWWILHEHLQLWHIVYTYHLCWMCMCIVLVFWKLRMTKTAKNWPSRVYIIEQWLSELLYCGGWAARPSNFCYICFIIFVLILFIFYPRNLLLCEWVPADSWLCSSIPLIPFPFRLVTWSAVCHVTELSGGRVAGGLAGHVECSWSVQVLGQRMRGKALWRGLDSESYDRYGRIYVVKVVSRRWAAGWCGWRSGVEEWSWRVAARVGWSQSGHGKRAGGVLGKIPRSP